VVHKGHDRRDFSLTRALSSEALRRVMLTAKGGILGHGLQERVVRVDAGSAWEPIVPGRLCEY
jgi:hypothetical protein